MEQQVADGVWVRQSEFMQSNSVVVQGAAGVLVVDAGVLDGELTALADDLDDQGRSVVAGFSTHPHWDHLLWHPRLGDVPRFGTARCAAAIGGRLAAPGFGELLDRMMPPEIVDRVPRDLLGQVESLPDGSTHVPWDGPAVRVVEHSAHAAGHAALLVEPARVLVAGDLVSDLLVPILDLTSTDPVGDYLAALQLLEDLADEVDVVVPGHGTVADRDELRSRIELDRVYVTSVRDGIVPDDSRIGPRQVLAER